MVRCCQEKSGFGQELSDVACNVRLATEWLPVSSNERPDTDLWTPAGVTWIICMVAGGSDGAHGAIYDCFCYKQDAPSELIFNDFMNPERPD